MDDWVILVTRRHKMRRVIKNMHDIMRGLKLRLAASKTFIGRIRKGFDFLGYRFNHRGLIGISQKTIDNFRQKRLRLYEQNASDQRVQAYKRNWQRWIISGL